MKNAKNTKNAEDVDVTMPTGPVFISHSSRDAASAHDLVAALEAAGVGCWISGRDVAPGANYQEAIVAAIRGGRAMVVLVSEAANASDEVKKELSLASAAGVPVYPVRFGAVTPNLALAYELATRQWIEGGAVPLLAARLAAAIGGSALDSLPPEAPVHLAPADKPSLVVLPFQNMSGEPDQEYFADGMVEDITSGLARIGWLLVTGRNTAFTYKGRAVDLRQLGRELGVRYALEGSVRKAGGRVRITCQLIETAGGNHVWTERFDGELADIFDLQDRITESVVSAIEPSLQRAEIARARAKPTASLDAYDLYLRALPLYYARTGNALESAVALLRRALEIDPAYVRARSFLSATLHARIVNGLEAPGDRETAIALARAVVATDTDDLEALVWTTGPLSVLAGDHPAAIAALHRAIRLHPNSALVLATLGHVHCFSNEMELAMGYLERAIRLSPPLDPMHGFMQLGLGRAHLLAGHTEMALPFLLRAVQDIPNATEPPRMLIHALSRLGRLDEARAVAARLHAVRPDYRVDSGVQSHLYSADFRTEHRQALLAAGLPE